VRNAISGIASPSAHPGLWLQRLAPEPQQPGKGLNPDDKDALLDQVSGIQTPDVYFHAFARWRVALSPTCFTCEVKATSRLIIGHGEPTPLEVGLALHPTYGVPYLPGSALKGVVSHYVHAYRGAVAAPWLGPTFRDRNGTVLGLGDGTPAGAPGDWYRTVFGSPAIPNVPDSDWKGYVRFEDALLVPDQQHRLALERDCVTPHQATYYKHHGASPPIDWDSPNPVGLLSVRPGTRFLLAVSFERDAEAWADLALRDLLVALDELGVGARTTAGYGRLRQAAPMSPPAEPVDPVALDALRVQVGVVKSATGNTLASFDSVDFEALLAATSPADRPHALEALTWLLQNTKLKKKRGDKLQALRAMLATPDNG